MFTKVNNSKGHVHHGFHDMREGKIGDIGIKKQVTENI